MVNILNIVKNKVNIKQLSIKLKILFKKLKYFKK